nr:hypothetical protein CFP56_14048 [Quercus suber]
MEELLHSKDRGNLVDSIDCKPSPALSHFYTKYLPPSPIFLIFFSDHANVSLSPSDPFHALPPNSLISQTHIPQLVFTSYSTPNICFR